MQLLTAVYASVVVLKTMIKDNYGKNMGELSILDTQEPVDAVYEFGIKYGLTREQRYNVLVSVCNSKKITCKRDSPLVFSQDILDEHKEVAGTLEVLEHEEPVDAIHQFVVSKQLPFSAREQLMKVVCNKLMCQRKEAVVFQQNFVLEDGVNLGNLVVLEGQEVADVVHQFGGQYLDANMRYNMVKQICEKNGTTCSRDRPVLLSTPIMGDNDTLIGNLQVLENEESVDAIYKFARTYNMSKPERYNLLVRLCELQRTPCNRDRAVLFSAPIAGPNGERLDDIVVYEDEEPADVVYKFALMYSMDRPMWTGIIHQICSSDSDMVHCERESPIVFSAPVAAENGSTLGYIHIEDGQEPVDAVGPFCKKHDLGKDQRLNILQGVCRASGIPCARAKMLYYTRTIKKANGDLLGYFNILEDEEPVDKIYEFGIKHGLDFDERKALLVDTCWDGQGRFNCTRAEPMLYSQVVMEDEHKELGTLEILEEQEPIDVVYAFLEKHDLFQSPANTSLIEGACNSTRVNCTRDKPRRTLFTIQATWYGIPHTIRYVKPESDWECTEHHGGQKCTHYVEIYAKQFCARHMKSWDACFGQVSSALRQQLDQYETDVWKGKDLYAKLGLVRTATDEEIAVAYNTLVLRYNNETEPLKYEKLQDAYRKLSDPEEKYYYDLPCMKFFGLCGKRQKDGGISISPD